MTRPDPLEAPGAGHLLGPAERSAREETGQLRKAEAAEVAAFPEVAAAPAAQAGKTAVPAAGPVAPAGKASA